MSNDQRLAKKTAPTWEIVEAPIPRYGVDAGPTIEQRLAAMEEKLAAIEAGGNGNVVRLAEAVGRIGHKVEQLIARTPHMQNANEELTRHGVAIGVLQGEVAALRTRPRMS